MGLFGPSSDALPQTSLPFRLLCLFVIRKAMDKQVQEEKNILSPWSGGRKGSGFIHFLGIKTWCRAHSGQQKISCLFQWALREALRMNLIIYDISCLKPGQLKARLSSWTPAKAAARIGTSGTILLIHLKHCHRVGWNTALSTCYRQSGTVSE